MLTTYGVWIEGASEADVTAIKASLSVLRERPGCAD
jgi:hypothetical protein